MIKILDFKADTQPVNIILKSLFSVLHTPDKNIEIIIKETLLGYIYMGDCTDLQVIALKICQIFMKNIKKDFIGRV